MDKYSQYRKTWLFLWMALGLYGVLAAEDRTIRLPALEVSDAKDVALPISVASAVVNQGKEPPLEPLHRSKRTLTTICVEIKPSGPLEEPYYMCKGENFGTENKQSCVEFKPGGAQGELYYMCKGNDFANGNGQADQHQHQPSPYGQSPLAVAPAYQQQAAPIAHTFPSFPAFGGGLFPGQQQYETPATTYQEQRPSQGEYQQQPQQQPYNSQQQSYTPAQQQQQNVPQQHQNVPQQQSQYPERPQQQPFYNAQQQFGYPGGPLAPPATASAAQSNGLPAVHRPNPGSPSALQYGVAAGAGPTATPTAYNPAAAQKPAAATKAAKGQQYEASPVVGSRHQPGLDGDVLGMPRVDFQVEEFRQKYRGFTGEPPMQQQRQELAEPQMVWLPPSPVDDPQDDPVMRSFYNSLAPQPFVGARADPTLLGAAAPPIVGAAAPPMVGAADPKAKENLSKMPPTLLPFSHREEVVGQSYQPIYSQSAEPPAPPTLPPPPPTYARPELPPANLETAPNGYNPYCNSCNTPPRPCPADTGVSYSTVCPSFQPVIIAMPCYEQQPTHYLALPNRVPNGGGGGITRNYGNELPAGSPYGPSFGIHQQVGSPYGMPQQVGSAYGMNQQVGSPFGANQQVGSPFGGNQQVGSHFGANQQVGSHFGANQQGGSAFGNAPQVGSSFGMAPQVGSPFGMAPQMAPGNSPGFNMNMGAQVGSPFGLAGPQVGAGFGMGLNPFGPFGSLNPFNPFNRMLGAAAPTAPQPPRNGLQRIFQLESTTTTSTEAPSLGTTVQQSSEKSGKLNFSSSTPTSAPSSTSSEPSLGSALAADEDEHEEDEEEEDAEPVAPATPPATSSEEDASGDTSLEAIPLGKLTAKDLMNKAEESLKTDTENPLKTEKRKRHNVRANKGINQKRKYLQQL